MASKPVPPAPMIVVLGRRELLSLKNIQAQIENPLARHYVEGNTYMCTGKLDSKTEFLILYKS